MRTKRWLIWAGMFGVAIHSAASATSQEAEQVIQGRIASYREIGTAYKHIGDALKSKHPDLSKIKESAQLIKERGADMLHWFPPGSEPPAREEKSWLDIILGLFSSNDALAIPGDTQSNAKPAVWTQRAKFEHHHRTFEIEAQRMVQVAHGGQTPAISVQFKKLGESCAICHKVFREEDD